MKVPKKVTIGLSIFGGVLVLGAAGFLLVRGIMQLKASEISLELEKKRLKDLYDKKPFPASTNIALEKANVALLDEWYQKLAAAMREKQVEPVQMSPSQFKSLLQSKKPELIDLGNAGGKVVDADFGFGFERYFSSTMLPEPGDVPRLAQQLRITEEICQVLFAEKIDRLNAIVREVFERSPDDAGGEMVVPTFVSSGRSRSSSSSGDMLSIVNKSAGVLKPDDLFTKFHFVVDFRAKEGTLWTILNRLSTHRRVTKENEEVKMFVVVTGLDMVKDMSDLESIKAKIPVPMATKEKTNAVPAAPKATARGRLVVSAIEEVSHENSQIPEDKLTKEQRVVCGPDFEKPIKIRLDLDVYRFRGE